MKKLLALTLSLLLVFAVVPMAMIANAEDEYTRVLNNFDDIGRLNGSVEWVNGSTGKSATVLDYTTIDPTYTDGNVLKIVPYNSNGNLAVPVDPSWSLNSPIGIKFQVWAETSGTFDTERTGLTNAANTVAFKMSDLGSNPTGVRNLPMSTTPEWITYDLTSYDKPILKLLFNSAANFYIDNVTLIYETAEDVPANLEPEYRTAYDWETDTTGVSKVGSTTFARNTAAAYSGIETSTYGLKVVGTYSKNASYMKVEMTDELKAAGSIRVPMRFDVANTSGNPTQIGVVIDNVNYWYMFGNAKNTMSFEYFDFKTYKSNDGVSIDFTRDYSNVTALLFSFGNNYSNFYVDDIQYANLKASEPVEPAETDGLTTDAVSTDDKASIRLTDDGGIRFYTTFDESKVTGTVEEIGTLIGPSDLVGTYLTNEDVEAGNAVAVPYLADTLWDGNQFVGSIAKIKTTNYARDFVARGYVKVDGVYYYSTTTATRNVRFVADAYIADPNGGYADLDEATKAIVDKFATPKA